MICEESLHLPAIPVVMSWCAKARPNKSSGDKLDAVVKRRLAEQVRREFDRRIGSAGFVRSKPTFWVRPRLHVVEFIHLHLYKFGPCFRAHLGIRVLNDDFVAPALNGPDSHSCWTNGKPDYPLDFDDAKIGECVGGLFAFYTNIGAPWFERFGSPESLLKAESPLRDSERTHLEKSLRGAGDSSSITLSKRLLGVA